MKNCIVFLYIVFLIGSEAAEAESVLEPSDYRGEPYRGTVPETLEGAIVISTETAYALWKTDRVGFIDVLPHTPKPSNLPAGTVWRDKLRNSIPNSIWLSNSGYQELANVDMLYFRQGLESISGGDLHRPLVFFCLTECWMSWNAAKRALAFGYDHIFWYPEGTDGWSFADYPLQKTTPWSNQ